MSTNSYSEDCYFCGGKDSAMICQDTKPPTADYLCIECGQYSIVKWDRMSLDELNDERKYCFELEPLKERKEQF